MNRLLISATLLLFFLCSCNSKYGFRDVSSFKIDSAALKANEPIEVIYASGGPDYNSKAAYFYHYMVVSQQTGDTINLLSPFVIVKPSEDNRLFNFIPYHSTSGKMLMRSMVTEMGADATNLPDVDSLVLPEPKQVVVNHDFEAMSNNQHRWTIGFLGTVRDGSPVKQ